MTERSRSTTDPAAGGSGRGEVCHRVPVVTSDGIFLGRVPADIATRLVGVGAGAFIGTAMHLRVPVPASAGRIEDALRRWGTQGLQATDHQRVVVEPAAVLPPLSKRRQVSK